MAFEKGRHTFNSKGFLIDKETGGVAGQNQRPHPKHENDGGEYPKWVKAHKSHVVEVNGNKIAPLWPDCAIDRHTKDVSVLVHDQAEEEKALGVEYPEDGDEAIERELDKERKLDNKSKSTRRTTWRTNTRNG